MDRRMIIECRHRDKNYLPPETISKMQFAEKVFSITYSSDYSQLIIETTKNRFGGSGDIKYINVFKDTKDCAFNAIQLLSGVKTTRETLEDLDGEKILILKRF